MNLGHRLALLLWLALPGNAGFKPGAEAPSGLVRRNRVPRRAWPGIAADCRAGKHPAGWGVKPALQCQF